MTKSSNARFYSFVAVMLSLGVVIASRSSGKNPQSRINEQEGLIKPIESIEDLRIINKTSGFSVVQIKKISDTVFEITYKNDYSKAITGFEVATGSMRVQTELILGGDEQQFISPGNTFEKSYVAQEGMDRDGIQILAVVFDDGSSDGDIKYIKEITDYRLGMKTERKRGLALLEKVISSKNQSISIAMDELEAHLSSTIPSTQQEGRLDNVGLGIRNERRRMLDDIRVLKDKHPRAQVDEQQARHLKEELVSAKTRTEKIIKFASLSSGPQRRSQ